MQGKISFALNRFRCFFLLASFLRPLDPWTECATPTLFSFSFLKYRNSLFSDRINRPALARFSWKTRCGCKPGLGHGCDLAWSTLSLLISAIKMLRSSRAISVWARDYQDKYKSCLPVRVRTQTGNAVKLDIWKSIARFS
jgi:hypothetical protein